MWGPLCRLLGHKVEIIGVYVYPSGVVIWARCIRCRAICRDGIDDQRVQRRD